MMDSMVSLILKLIVAAYLCSHQVSCEKEKGIYSNITAPTTTTTTSTTAPPSDLSGEASDHLEASSQLDPRDTRPHSKSSYSNQDHPYGHRFSTPVYRKNIIYEDQAVEYVTDTRTQNEQFYKDGEDNNYHHQHPQQQRLPHHADYVDSFEPPHDQQRYGSQEHGYEEQPKKERNVYSVRDHASHAPSHYGHQGYAKEESHESDEDSGDQNDARQPYLQYAYEIAHKKQEATYDSLAVPDTDGKSKYGPGETKVQPPVSYQHTAYYTRPKTTRYQPEDDQEDAYNSEQHRGGNYFQALPKVAGYVPDGQEEPGYFQAPFKKTTYTQEAGYSDTHQQPQAPKASKSRTYKLVAHSQTAEYLKRQHESHNDHPGRGHSLKQHEDILQILRKKATGPSEGGRVSIHIKHLGHALADVNRDGKERQGFLLLPIVPNTIEKIRGAREKYLNDDHKSGYQRERVHIYQQRPVPEKDVYSHQEIPNTRYAVDSKATRPHDYEISRPQEKSSTYTQYGLFQPVAKHPTYEDSKYDAPRAPQLPEYSDEISQKGYPVASTNAAPYEERKEVKTYPKSHLSYDSPRGIIPSFTGSVKYQPASVVDKPHGYEAPYGTQAYKSLPLKVRGQQPSFYPSFPHYVDYPKAVDYSSFNPRPKKKQSETRQMYSRQYRNVGSRLASEYERSKSDPNTKTPKSSYVSQSSDKGSDAFRPIYTSQKYGKPLGELGLHQYESVLSKQKIGRTAVGGLYYDLAPYSATRNVPQIQKGSNSKNSSPKIEIYV